MISSCIVGGPLRTERLPDGRRALLEPLEVKVCGYHIRVEPGFRTDFSSIPTPLSWIAKWSKVDIAGVVHDMLFQPRDLGSIYRLSDTEREENLIDRIHIGTADRIWRKIARSGKHRANALSAGLGWLGLYAFGWWTWNNYRGASNRRIAWLEGWLWRVPLGVVSAFSLLTAICQVLYFPAQLAVFVWSKYLSSFAKGFIES